MDIVEMLSSFGQAVANLFRHRTHRSELRNVPTIAAAKRAQDEADAVAKETEAVKNRKIEEIRKNIADQ